MSKIIFQYSAWLILLCVCIGLFYAIILYSRSSDFSTNKNFLKYILFGLRAVAVTLISLFLLAPLIRKITDKEVKPVIVLAQDYSLSLTNVYNKNQLTQINNNIKTLKSKLSDKYDVQAFSLGENVTPGLKDSFDLKSTNISSLMSYVNSAFDSKELSAVILSSDGIYNEGDNPDYVPVKNTAPIYTIALGDTTLRKDAKVQNIYNNNIVFIDDITQIKCDLSVVNGKGSKMEATFSEYLEGNNRKIIAKNSLTPNSDNYFTSFNFQTQLFSAGIHKFNISVSNLSGEISYKNNSRDFYIEVIDSKLSVLIYANSPHPDISAMHDLLLNLKNYKIDIKYFGDKIETSKYDIVIYHNLPSAKNDITSLHNQLINAGIPELYFIGLQTDLTKLNKLQTLISIKNPANSSNEVQSEINKDFGLFKLPDVTSTDLNLYPPLLSPFATYVLSPDGKALMNQKIKNIGTDYPLLCFSTGARNKVGIFTAINFYKWKFYDFAQNKNNNLTTSLLNESIQYLCLKKDKSKWQVSINKNLLDETDNIIFNAELYNENYQRITDPEATLKIFDKSRKEFDFTFSRVNDHYELDAGNFPPGTYEYIASVKSGNQNLSKKGRFTITNKDIEFFDLTADHGMLNKMSQRTGGQLYHPDQINKLIDKLQSLNVKPVLYSSEDTRLALDFKSLFWLILLLLTGEWLLRKLNGRI